VKRICIDLDGTICTLRNRTGDYENAEPLPGAVETINGWYDEGHHIIIFTARRMRTHAGDVEKVIADVGQLTKDWLARHGVRYHELIFGKPYAHVYVDDLAKRFEGDWPEVHDHVEGIARVESDPGKQSA
jgi:capsule biosynthesis phosphatase